MIELIKEPIINFKPTLEQISIAVAIENIDDFSYFDGFQICMRAKSLILDLDVQIIELFKTDEEHYLNDVVSNITPGSECAFKINGIKV